MYDVFYLLTQTRMEENEIEKAKAFIIVEIIEYISNSVVIKTIIKKQLEM